MKNFNRKERSFSNEKDLVDAEKKEQQVPITNNQENRGYAKNNYVFNSINKPVTESPSRQNLTSTLNQQQYDPENNTPVYVPPFLKITPLRSHHHSGPSDYLPWSVANIFVCVIIAVPALFFSIQTRDLKRAGDVKKAKVNSRRSLILNIIASIIGLLTILLAVILRFAVYQLFVYNDINSQNVPIIAGG